MDASSYLPIVLIIASAAAALGVFLYRSRTHHASRQEDVSMSLGQKSALPVASRSGSRQAASLSKDRNRTAPSQGDALQSRARSAIRRYCALLDEKTPLLLELRRSELLYANAENADTLIKRAFWKSGGIRFFSEELLHRLEALAPDADVPTMRIDVYQSVICPVLKDLSSLRAKRESLMHDAPQIDPQALIAEKGLTPPVLPSQLSEAAVAELSHTLQTRENALKDACSLPQNTYIPRQEQLLQDLLTLYECDDALILRPDQPEAPSAEACHAAMNRLKDGVSALLSAHTLPI